MRYGLRPIATDDDAFLRRVYGSTREEELAPLGWSRAAVDAFLDQQFFAQTRHYDESYPDAQRSIVLVDGEPAGRLLVHRGPRDIRLVDVALLPAFRGSGVGSAILDDLIAEASAKGVTISIHVEQSNRARRLYERHGFVPVSEHGIYFLFERRPEAALHP